MKKLLIAVITLAFLLIPFTAFAQANAYNYTKKDNCIWVPQADGGWMMIIDDQVVSDIWIKYENHWYMFGKDGRMLTGWQTRDGEWYYLSESTEDMKHPYGSAYIKEAIPNGMMTDDTGAIIGCTGMARPNKYGKTCVEISISEQTCYVYQDYTLVLTTPVVTGKMTEKRQTPLGEYTIYAKQTDRFLEGDNEDGTRYKSHVDFWMPFNGGVGLHDASWRGKFGGSIYVNSGSHGCVNMPRAAAEALYNIAYIGMPVIVHN